MNYSPWLHYMLPCNSWDMCDWLFNLSEDCITGNNLGHCEPVAPVPTQILRDPSAVGDPIRWRPACLRVPSWACFSSRWTCPCCTLSRSTTLQPVVPMPLISALCFCSSVHLGIGFGWPHGRRKCASFNWSISSCSPVDGVVRWGDIGSAGLYAETDWNKRVRLLFISQW
jgi:hypothetical protein